MEGVYHKESVSDPDDFEDIRGRYERVLAGAARDGPGGLSVGRLA
jgi:hypothetical protein